MMKMTMRTENAIRGNLVKRRRFWFIFNMGFSELTMYGYFEVHGRNQVDCMKFLKKFYSSWVSCFMHWENVFKGGSFGKKLKLEVVFLMLPYSPCIFV